MDTLSRLRSGQLAGCTRLDLCCGLTEFPREIFQLADSLEILNLSGNALTTLPDDLPRLTRLRVIFCSENAFSTVPEVLGRCDNLEMIGFKSNKIKFLDSSSLPPKLRWLILTDNRLEVLPPELGRCHRLQKLMLAGNKLRALPEELANCRNLELLRISANQLTALPEWLLTLPRLSWLAFAGNPFSEQEARLSQAAELDWHSLELQQKLGEGASGIIHRARLRHTPEQEWAVKLFKGKVTSDGWPRSEKAACLAAGVHPNLIAATGRLAGHPDGARGLVMPLADARFKTLAGPPSLESCTRDIYPPSVCFTLPVLLSMAQGVAAAMEHLHGMGILHGDLYAHNLLWDGQGGCLLGDFGAASFVADAHHVAPLQRIEVRAFACLLEEWLQRCDAPPGELPTREALWELQRQCAQPDVLARPSLIAIRQILLNLTARS